MVQRHDTHWRRLMGAIVILLLAGVLASIVWIALENLLFL